MSIQNYLNQIKNAVFGKDVRESIHDAIKQCYDDAAVNHNNANMEVKLARGTHDTLNDRLDENEKNQEKISSQLDTKANKSTTDAIQGQINNLVLGAVGDGNNAEVIQARGEESILNDRLDNIENGRRLESLNIDALKSYDVINLNDYAYGSLGAKFPIEKPFENFNGIVIGKLDLATDLKKSDNEITLVIKYEITSKTVNTAGIAVKLYDNTWGAGKKTISRYESKINTPIYEVVKINKSDYQSFIQIQVGPMADNLNTVVKTHYVKIFDSAKFGEITGIYFDNEFVGKMGNVNSYPIINLNSLPLNIIDLLEKERIPNNISDYIGGITEGIEALKIFDTKILTDHIFNFDKPTQLITTDGNGAKIIEIPSSKLNMLDKKVTLVIRYSLDEQTTKTAHALRVFDSNWGAGLTTMDLSGNNIKNKKYTIKYTFNPSDPNSWILFRFSMIGATGEGIKTVINLDYAKLIYESDINSLDEINELHDQFGDLENYPITNFKVIPKKLAEQLNQENKNVIMIGDSIANQFAGAICTDNVNSEYNFLNRCIGGESTLDTMARLGAIPYVVLPPFTIPSGTVNSGEAKIISSLFLDVEFDSVTAKPTWKNGYLSNYSATQEGLNPYSALKCEINGIKGTMYFKRSTNVPHYFKRDVAGEELVLDRPTEIIPIDNSSYDKDAVYTCFMGTNEGWCNRFFEKDRTQLNANKNDADLLFSYYKRIAQHINTNKFLFMGFYMCAFLDQTTGEKRNEWWEYFEELMSKEFGNKYFSVRKYLREIGYKDAGVNLTAQDLQDIKDGKIPIIASTGDINGVHVTGRVAACVGNEILKRLKGMGYINSYNEIDVTKYSNGQTSTNPDDFLPPQ